MNNLDKVKTYTKKSGEVLRIIYNEKNNLANISVSFPKDIKEDGIIAGKFYFVCGGGCKDMINSFNQTVSDDVLS